MHPEARSLIEALSLKPHPEGGFYRETFRAQLQLSGLPQGARSASTAIYFLLPAGSFSALHRVNADEHWHHYDGDPVTLHTLRDDGVYEVLHLGRDYQAGERPQQVVPARVWQAATLRGERFSLCGCTVAPGFDFRDFELPSRRQLLELFPSQRELILKLSRESTP